MNLRRSKLTWTAMIVALMFLEAGCQRSGTNRVDANVALDFKPAPPQVGTAEVAATLTDSSGNPISCGELELEGNMNHAGMKPVFTTLKEVDPGHYAGTLKFTMAGDWFILVNGQLPGGGTIEEKIDVPQVTKP